MPDSPRKRHSSKEDLSTYQLYQLLGLSSPDDEQIADVGLIIQEIGDDFGSTGLFLDRNK